jgi:ubiquinone/menaquinone biosynthesis C-methylase UbiE
MNRRTTSRQERLGAVYEEEIWPLLPGRAAELLLRALPRRPGAVAFEAGCGAGALSLAVADRLDDTSRILAIDATPALVDLARARADRHPAGGKISFHVADPAPPLPIDDGTYDLAISNLALGDTADPPAALAALAAALKPGGEAVVTLLLRGSWGEFIDIYREVLTEQRKPEVLAALAAYEHTFPDPETAVRWLEAAGLHDVRMETARFEILFRSAREFFFAPLVDLGPLSRWKRIAGGRGDEMQDVFFFVKEAIDSYFAGAVFAVTMVVACLAGKRSE